MCSRADVKNFLIDKITVKFRKNNLMAVSKPGNGKRWRKRLLIAISIIVLLLFSAFIFREKLERAVIAITIYKQHIFSPPPEVASEGFLQRAMDNAGFYWDMSKLRVEREKRLANFNGVLKPLVKQIVAMQAKGQGMQYSMHIYREIRWRLNFTQDTAATRARINDLANSISQADEQKLATQQQPADGSWGLGINPWYLRLYYSVEDGLHDLKAPPQYPMLFLDTINSPQKLTAKLNVDLHDDFTKTGILNREELDETFSALARLLLGHKQINYTFNPDLKNALREFVNHWQNPATGMWGQWMVDEKGRIWKMDDMAMTFHVISDLNGDVGHLDKIARRVLELDGTNFPAGVRFDGSYANHLNWDVVTIFRYAWPKLDTATKQRAAAEISKMMDWCLAKSYQPDGSFKTSDLDDTLGDAYFYGVSFLADAGYFNSSNRFWTNRKFPNAKTIYDRIEAKLKSTGLADPEMKDAYEALMGRK